MKIIKRSGNIESFNLEKIRTSLENCANDVNVTLTEGDIKTILSDILSTLEKTRKDASPTSVYEIRGLIYTILINHKFETLCKAYMFEE
ncbi:ATP cone domain-containing protein [Hathewaya histolytica]|uniref:Anaerobic ribonucleoside-triphosphate reductase n=1 Tax=Hathewaya histolytica TaxID=1498 RepID=A0A4U9RNY5_HATHI|nr:ATP cone domain-containing protein [Hathewaya histolytica]VTQ93151.1 anaerobic ribonucleoside-triphosphate reductase [Hathewaya histolytica]